MEGLTVRQHLCSVNNKATSLGLFGQATSFASGLSTVELRCAPLAIQEVFNCDLFLFVILTAAAAGKP